jgi:hypothetical protein
MNTPVPATTTAAVTHLTANGYVFIGCAAGAVLAGLALLVWRIGLAWKARRA